MNSLDNSKLINNYNNKMNSSYISYISKINQSKYDNSNANKMNSSSISNISHINNINNANNNNSMIYSQSVRNFNSKVNVSKFTEPVNFNINKMNNSSNKKTICHDKSMTFDNKTLNTNYKSKEGYADRSSNHKKPVFVLKYMIDEFNILNGKVLQLPQNKSKSESNSLSKSPTSVDKATFVSIDDYDLNLKNLRNLRHYKHLIKQSAKDMMASISKGEDKNSFLKKHYSQLKKAKIRTSKNFDTILNQVYRSVQYYNEQFQDLGKEKVLNLVKNEVKTITNSLEVLMNSTSNMRKFVNRKLKHKHDLHMINQSKFYSTSKELLNFKKLNLSDIVTDDEDFLDDERNKRKISIFSKFHQPRPNSKSQTNIRPLLSPIGEKFDESDILDSSIRKNLKINDKSISKYINMIIYRKKDRWLTIIIG